MTEKIEVKRISKNEILVNDIVIKLWENNIMVFHAVSSPNEELANVMYQIDINILKEKLIE